MTDEARQCKAVVTAFEALQAAGIFLHDAKGQALDDQQFLAAMTLAMNAALRADAAYRASAGEDQRTLDDQEAVR